MQRIFVGDVQGCSAELESLLARAEARFGSEFELWSVGDLVNRGPDSRGVLERVRTLHEAGRARVVLGNHELSLIACHLGLREPHRRDTIGSLLAAPDAAEWVRWLRSLPLVETGSLAGRRFAMVHAAVHPDWSLDTLLERAREVELRLAAADDAEALAFLRETRLGQPKPGVEPGTIGFGCADWLDRMTCCRSVGPHDEWSSQPPGLDESAKPRRARVAWHLRWSKRKHDYGVVYGHWAQQGLHVAKGLRGLDTGCVHQTAESPGWLTAWLPDLGESGFVRRDERFWRERAKRAYYQV